jgi:hypothetical protein
MEFERKVLDAAFTHARCNRSEIEASDMIDSVLGSAGSLRCRSPRSTAVTVSAIAAVSMSASGGGTGSWRAR